MKYSLLKNVVAELAAILPRARVSKIHQPEAAVFLFKLWNGRETHRLLLSLKSDDSRLHLTGREWLNPSQPPRFCQLLRARVTRIDGIRVVNDDRIVQFDASGPKGTCRLMAELTGKTANLVLVDEKDVIIDVLIRDSGADSPRQLVAGAPYQLPEKKPQPDGAQDDTDTLPETASSWNSYLDNRQTQTDSVPTVQDIHQKLQQCIFKNQKKLKKRLDNIAADLNRQQAAEQYREMGDLLLANLHRVKTGMASIHVDDFFADPPRPMEIPLDPRLTPQHNAQNFFKRYKKAQRGIDHSLRRLEETQLELDWLEQLAYQLDDKTTPADLEAVAQELDEAGLFKPVGRHHKKRTQQPSVPHQAASPSGCVVLWGRNNRQNDLLSGRSLKPGDLWFHAKNCPGAHVVLKASSHPDAVTDADIHFAASIAAGYSRARRDSKVEVMQADAGAISRPKGGRTGLVTVKSYKTLLISPFRPE